MLLKKSISLMALALVAGVLAGCIREDRSDCPCDVFLDFVYTGDGDTDIFPDKIDRVNMYILKGSGVHSDRMPPPTPASVSPTPDARRTRISSTILRTDSGAMCSRS